MSKEKVTKLSPLVQLRNKISEEMREERKHILGKILTIVDAVVSDREQRKAFKDVVTDAVYDAGRLDYSKGEIEEMLLEFTRTFCSSLYPNENDIKHWFSLGIKQSSLTPIFKK